MKLFYLLFVIIYTYISYYTSFLSKILSIFYCFFYFLEYIFIFIFCNINIYYVILFKYWKKENYNAYKKPVILGNGYKKYNKKKEEKKKNITINKLLKFYYNRRMHFGITVVYMQMFFRRIKEKKNYFKYIFIYGLKIKYNNLKKKIIRNSLSFFFFFNYNLVFFLEYIKSKLLLFLMILKFLLLYNKLRVYLKIKQFFVLLYNIKLKW